jgi:hypothetical protein
MLHHEVSEVELPVELEGARMNGERARGGARFRRLVDDAHLDTELGEPKRQDEAGRAGTDDQNITMHCVPVRKSAVSRTGWLAETATRHAVVPIGERIYVCLRF